MKERAHLGKSQVVLLCYVLDELQSGPVLGFEVTVAVWEHSRSSVENFSLQ